MTPAVARGEIVGGYRTLYRRALRAIHFSKPARYVLRDTIRSAFRTGKSEHYDGNKVRNTLHFLDLAAQEQGMEHKVLKNILHVRYWQLKAKRDTKLVSGNTPLESQIRLNSYKQFDSTINMLNKSLGLCLR